MGITATIVGIENAAPSLATAGGMFSKWFAAHPWEGCSMSGDSLDGLVPGVNHRGLVRTRPLVYYVARLDHLTGARACSVASGVRQLNTASASATGPEPSQLNRSSWTAQGGQEASSVTDANDVALTDSGSAGSALTMARCRQRRAMIQRGWRRFETSAVSRWSCSMLTAFFVAGDWR